MGHVKREKSEIVLNQMDVLKEQVTYYSSLYCQSMQIEGSMKEIVGAFMNEEQFPKLDKEESLQ